MPNSELSIGWCPSVHGRSKFQVEPAKLESLTRWSCSSQRQPGRYSCHESRSVSVWPRPQHTELSSTRRVESSDLASRYTAVTLRCVAGRYCERSPALSRVSRPHVSLKSTQENTAGWL